MAAARGDAHAAAVLVQAGCAVDQPDHEGLSPLLVAARCGHAGAVRALLAAGARKEHVDFDGGSALMHAAGRGHSEGPSASELFYG